MDRDLCFLAALLHGRPSEQQQFYARQIPVGVFKIREQEFAWVYQFRERFNEYPSPEAFSQRFSE